MTPSEPQLKRAAVFVDGQNLYYSIREAFGYFSPNYDILKLAQAVCERQAWQLAQTNFYTGVPSALDSDSWHHFWVAKLGAMGHQGIKVFSRPLRYRNKAILLPDGTATVTMVGQEKGVDVRLALDVVRCVYHRQCDVIILFSQDQDLSEVADEIRLIAKEQNRWVKIASAFPISPTSPNRRGVNGTDWIRFDRALYDACLDKKDYRPK